MAQSSGGTVMNKKELCKHLEKRRKQYGRIFREHHYLWRFGDPDVIADTKGQCSISVCKPVTLNLQPVQIERPNQPIQRRDYWLKKTVTGCEENLIKLDTQPSILIMSQDQTGEPSYGAPTPGSPIGDFFLGKMILLDTITAIIAVGYEEGELADYIVVYRVKQGLKNIFDTWRTCRPA